MNYSCNSCGETWNQKEIQKAIWTGARFRINKTTGQFICPECYNTMRAAFISRPELFKAWKAWKAEHGFV